MIILRMNHMRDAKIEMLVTVGRAETRAELNQFLANEKVEPYSGGEWRKIYRQGGPLEWFNEPYSMDDHLHFVDVGTVDEYMENARQTYENEFMSIPQLGG